MSHSTATKLVIQTKYTNGQDESIVIYPISNCLIAFGIEDKSRAKEYMQLDLTKEQALYVADMLKLAATDLLDAHLKGHNKNGDK